MGEAFVGLAGWRTWRSSLGRIGLGTACHGSQTATIWIVCPAEQRGRTECSSSLGSAGFSVCFALSKFLGSLYSTGTCGVVLPNSFGIGPGVCVWGRLAPAEHATYQPRLSSGNNIHYSRLPFSALCKWTSARCGHHPFHDGKSARHRQMHSPECLCGATSWTFLHSIRSCPLFELHRQQWLRRLRLQRMPRFGDAELLRWIFDPSIVINGRSAENAHVMYVASVCQAVRSLRDG